MSERPACGESLVLATRNGLYRITEDGGATALSERRDPIWELAGDPATWYPPGVSTCSA